jgi:hypothetical protein
LRVDPFAVGAGVAFTIAAAVYLRTLLPGVAFGDWAEAQTIPHVLGIAHPTGYPTYIILAWLFELLPFGSVAFRANLLSALCTAAALATLVLILGRLGVRPVLAVVTALGLATVGTVWAAATVARVDPLHLLLITLLVHRALRWSDGLRPRDLALFGLLLGLAIGNHLLTLTVAPFLVGCALWSGRRELLVRPTTLVLAGGMVLLGLTVYLYIPWAAAGSAPLQYNHPTTLASVLWLVSGQQFRGQFGFLSPAGAAQFLASLPALAAIVAGRATAIGPVVGLVGLALLVRRRPAFGLACLGMLVMGVYVWATYQQVEQYYLLVPFVMLAIGAGVCLESCARLLAMAVGRAYGWLRGRAADAAASQRFAAVTIGGAWTVFVLTFAASTYAANDRSQDRSAQIYVDEIFAALPPDGAIVSYWDTSTPLWYAHYVEHVRPDALIVDDTNLAYDGWGTADRRIASLICQRPVLLIRIGAADLAPIEHVYHLSKVFDVRVGSLSPSAAVTQQVYRIERPGPPTCAANATSPASPA